MNSYSKRQAGRTGSWLQALMALILGAMLLAAGPARAATETITYIHGDISGSPLAATSSTGAVVWKESYRAYGERWVNDPGSAQQSQWFHGKEQDAATGLQYFGQIIGDHTKIAIMSTMNTGSIYGIAAQIFGGPQGLSSPLPRRVRDFAFGAGVAEIDPTLATARTVLMRRGRELTPDMAGLIALRHRQSTANG